ncbi:MAG: Rpn family recombination-promoting nuclease/putative transposase [Lachnospiraceae bacterium]|nr:Rpn family recombination-promoting nuclease/putative transposase [Lachnospiraceae bacterium]
MGEKESKDTVDYVYLSDNERYADLINGVLFGGKQVLNPAMLEERDSRVVVSKKKTKARDIVRKYGKEAAYMVLGVENQEEVSYCMPFRMLQYETAEYAKQVSAVRKRNRNVRKVTAGEFLEKYKKGDKIQPCVSLVLFWGSAWDGPMTLQEMLDMDAVPKYLKFYVNDYAMHLVNVREIEDTSVFKTDLRQVFDFMKCAEDMEKVQELIKDNPDYMHVDMEAYDVMMVHGHSEVLERIRENVKEEGGNVCKGLTDWGKQERALGHAEGRSEGLEIGLKNLVKVLIRQYKGFEELYNSLIGMEGYENVTREQVKKYV